MVAERGSDSWFHTWPWNYLMHCFRRVASSKCLSQDTIKIITIVYLAERPESDFMRFQCQSISKMVFRFLCFSLLSGSSPLSLFSTPRTWARRWISKCDPLLESGFHFHPPSGPPGLFHWVHAEMNHNWNPTQPTDQHWYLLRPPTASLCSPQTSSYAWALASITRQEAHVHSWSPFHHLISHEILPFFFWFKVPDLLLGNHCSYTVSLHPLLSRQNSASYGCQVNLSKAQVWSHHSLALKSSVAP